MKIVLLHGALGAAEQILPLASELQKEGITPVVLELPGHGKTPLGNIPFSIEGFVVWLEKELEKKNLSKLPFFGFSMGGYIALYLSFLKKIPTKEIVTLGTKFNWTQESAAKELTMLNPEKILEKVPKFAHMLNNRHENWREVLANTEKLMVNLGNKPLLKEIESSKITNKTLVLRGEADQMVTEDESRNMAEWLPNGHYKALSGIPHPLEQVPPRHVALEIKQFLRYE